jgi:hypothetical protein
MLETRLEGLSIADVPSPALADSLAVTTSTVESRVMVPEAHTPFSWGVVKRTQEPERDGSPAAGAAAERVSFLVQKGAVVRCHLISVAGAADWTLPLGPSQYRTR